MKTAINPNRGTGLNWNENAPVARRVEQNLAADFQVVQGQTPVQTVSEPDASVLEGLLQVHIYPNVSKFADFDMDVETSGLPVDVAFEVILRFRDKEYPAGSVAIHKGVASGIHSIVEKLPPNWPARADVILRSSEAVARDTVDMTRIWKGEIVLPNVPLPAPAATPATAPSTTSPSTATTSAKRSPSSNPAASGYGLVTHFRMPGDLRVQSYQPLYVKHPQRVD